MVTDDRLFCCQLAEQLQKTVIPYLYGGNDPAEGGVDCSGFVRFIFRQLGMMKWKADRNAQGFFCTYRKKVTMYPYPGCLVFYGPNIEHIKHVMLCLDASHCIGSAKGYVDWDGVQTLPIDYRPDKLVIVDPFMEG